MSAADFRAQGMTLRQIGDALGVSTTTVQRLLSPEKAELMRQQSNAAKRRRTGLCVDCGAVTRYNGHGTSERCLPCGAIFNGQQQTIWTRERIISLIQEWAAEHDGDPPATPDWNPNLARRMNDEDRAIRFESRSYRWPWSTNVILVFGSWNAAIAAAGFQPRVANGAGGIGRSRGQRAKAAA